MRSQPPPASGLNAEPRAEVVYRLLRTLSACAETGLSQTAGAEALFSLRDSGAMPSSPSSTRNAVRADQADGGACAGQSCFRTRPDAVALSLDSAHTFVSAKTEHRSICAPSRAHALRENRSKSANQIWEGPRIPAPRASRSVLKGLHWYLSRSTTPMASCAPIQRVHASRTAKRLVRALRPDPPISVSPAYLQAATVLPRPICILHRRHRHRALFAFRHQTPYALSQPYGKTPPVARRPRRRRWRIAEGPIGKTIVVCVAELLRPRPGGGVLARPAARQDGRTHPCYGRTLTMRLQHGLSVSKEQSQIARHTKHS